MDERALATASDAATTAGPVRRIFCPQPRPRMVLRCGPLCWHDFAETLYAGDMPN
jgi:hypothetical protein